MEKRIIICISRQFGSGGHLVGELLAKRLGIPYYDKELLSLTADEHNVSEAVVKAVDEKPVTWSMLVFRMVCATLISPKLTTASIMYSTTVSFTCKRKQSKGLPQKALA